MGRKFSFFLAEFMKAGFEPLATKKVEYTITDKMVAITKEGEAGFKGKFYSVDSRQKD